MKRDPFVAMVLKANKRAGYRYVIPIQVAVDCLRRQHRRVVLVIVSTMKQQKKARHGLERTMPASPVELGHIDGGIATCEIILRAMKRLGGRA